MLRRVGVCARNASVRLQMVQIRAHSLGWGPRPDEDIEKLAPKFLQWQIEHSISNFDGKPELLAAVKASIARRAPGLSAANTQNAQKQESAPPSNNNKFNNNNFKNNSQKPANTTPSNNNNQKPTFQNNKYNTNQKGDGQNNNNSPQKGNWKNDNNTQKDGWQNTTNTTQKGNWQNNTQKGGWQNSSSNQKGNWQNKGKYGGGSGGSKKQFGQPEEPKIMPDNATFGLAGGSDRTFEILLAPKVSAYMTANNAWRAGNTDTGNAGVEQAIAFAEIGISRGIHTILTMRLSGQATEDSTIAKHLTPFLKKHPRSFDEATISLMAADWAKCEDGALAIMDTMATAKITPQRLDLSLFTSASEGGCRIGKTLARFSGTIGELHLWRGNEQRFQKFLYELAASTNLRVNAVVMHGDIMERPVDFTNDPAFATIFDGKNAVREYTDPKITRDSIKSQRYTPAKPAAPAK